MLNYLKNEFNETLTENNARAYKTTNSGLLNFFAQGGALRNRNEIEIVKMFYAAMQEDKIKALKLLFYFRDIRGGQGERRTFRIIAKHIASVEDQSFAKAFVDLIPEYGRWDDVYEFFGTKNQPVAIEAIRKQLILDLDQIRFNKPISLLAKWLKSENATSLETKALAKATREGLDLTPRQYRKILSRLRKYLKIVENQMRENDWDGIEYSEVPSKAMFKYREAFRKHNPEVFAQFMEDVMSGKKKVNTETLYPYEIVRTIMNRNTDFTDRQSLNMLWEKLPDYTSDSNALVVVDTSGSMFGGGNIQPIHVSVSLGLYLAERNKGFYHNYFITFSEKPSLVKITGKDIVDKVNFLSKSDWGYNTNLEAVFTKILHTAVKNNLDQSEMPERIIIISDMEFDMATDRNRGVFSFERYAPAIRDKRVLMDTIKDSYRAKGYIMPTLVFWNVDARNEQFPMKKEDEYTLLVSGMSPAIAKAVLSDEFITPESLMYEIINKERYEKVEQVFRKVS